METLLYFALWAGMIFLMMRVGCGAHVMGRGGRHRSAPNPSGRGNGGGARWIAPRNATDTVCGKNVVTDHARPSVYAGDVYYFCSRDCREIFEAAPDVYAPGGKITVKGSAGEGVRGRSHG